MPTITINNYACMATINQLIDRQALYLTTITTAAGTVLLFKLLLLPFTAKPTPSYLGTLLPYCLSTALQV